jgi:hypothetical protein
MEFRAHVKYLKSNDSIVRELPQDIGKTANSLDVGKFLIGCLDA